MMKFKEAEAIIKPHIKENGKVFLYPQGRQYGNVGKQAEPVAFDARRAAKNLMTGGWGLAPNFKDVKTTLTVIEKAQTEFATKEAAYEAKIKQMEAELEAAKNGKVEKVSKTAKV